MLEVSFHSIITTAWQIIKNWWWLPLPFLLWKPFVYQYLFWRNDSWLKRQKKIILEIKIPREILKPIRAMETVISSIHGAVYHPADWWEKWIDGQFQLSVNLEIASVDGKTRFFIRVGSPYREAVESALYSQFPDIEIIEVDEYIKYVPQSIPNKEWDLWATDYHLAKDDHYPIKTYPEFETEHEAKEEKRVDPVASLLEAMAKVKPGEQFWIQISVVPIAVDSTTTPNAIAWMAKGEELRDKLARRTEKTTVQKPIIQEVAEILITGKQEEPKEEEREIIPPEMKLTPGEREVIMALEKKLSKPLFLSNIRFIYLGKRDVWFKPNFRLGFSFFNSYMTLNCNGLLPYGPTLTKIHKSWFLPLNSIRLRRHYLRCRKIFRNYIRRLTSYFPLNPRETSFVLNTEEVSSLFHFPTEVAAPAPGAPRLEAKKKGEPSGLPVE